MLEVRPFTKPKTILQWFQEQEKLDISPSYQRRGDLWPERYKQLLINSVLNRYDVPKIYVADFTYSNSKLNESRKPYAMIDGKQRLSTFFSFLSDGLKLDDTPVLTDDREIVLKGLKYSDLKKDFPELARRFEGFVPTVMSVISDSLEEIQELFIRLNLSVSISGPERRNAMPGPLPHLIRELSVHEFFRQYATFPISRGQDLNAAAKFLLMEFSSGFVSMKKLDLDRFVKNNQDASRAQFDKFLLAASQTLSTMTKVFLQRDALLAGQAEIPAYYWLVKECPRGKLPTIRPLLVDFEKKRFEARKAAADRAAGKSIPSPSSTLIEYNRVIRSPDDKRSQEFMFETLRALVS